MICVICFENNIETVYVPCGHRACCIKCSYSLLNDCPICQLPANCIKTFDVVLSDDDEEPNQMTKTAPIKQDPPYINYPNHNNVKRENIIDYYKQFKLSPQNIKNKEMAIKHLCGKIRYRQLHQIDIINPGQTVRYFMMKKNGNVQLSSERIIESSTQTTIKVGGKKDTEINKTEQIYIRFC